MMTTITRKPRAGDPVRDLFNAVFGDVANCCGNGNTTARIPLDIIERENEYELNASLPGFEKKDVSLEVEKGVLTITASKQESANECAENNCCEGSLIRSERYAGSLTRTIKLPDYVEASALCASLKNGVLTVKVNKPTLPEAQRIEIA